MQKPVEVPSNPAVPTTMAALRYAVVIGFTFAAGAGWVERETADTVVESLDVAIPAAVALGTVALGLWRTFKFGRKAAVAAEAAPNTVAVTK